MEYYYKFALYITFGVLPSLVWLFYYLRKDLHPEPKRMIVKMFVYGAMITVPVFFVQLGLSHILRQFHNVAVVEGHPIFFDIVKWFLVIGFTEEFFKYLVVRFTVLESYEVDEPLDIMLYMVVSALGFAALENVLYFFSPINQVPLDDILKATVTLSLIRFVGATFLHTLCSALIGYLLALATVRGKKKWWFVAVGIMVATLLHGLYDFSIITLPGPLNVAIPSAIISVLALFMVHDFNEIKKMKGICFIKPAILKRKKK